MIGTIARQSDGIVNQAIGQAAADGTALVFTLGFTARHVIVINETDLIRWEKLGNQAANTCLKQVAAGTLTLDTTSAIVIDGNQVTINAAAAPAGKAIKIVAR